MEERIKIAYDSAVADSAKDVLNADNSTKSPEELYEILVNDIRKYRPSTDISLIEKAYHTALKAHEGQYRRSGEPYIIHPLCVAIILARLELDKETIIGGILHDVVEDTVLTSKEVSQMFGPEVALLVDGVTKLTQLNQRISAVLPRPMPHR